MTERDALLHLLKRVRLYVAARRDEQRSVVEHDYREMVAAAAACGEPS